MKRGECIIFRTKESCSNWSESYEGAVIYDASCFPFLLYIGTRPETHESIIVSISPKTSWRCLPNYKSEFLCGERKLDYDENLKRFDSNETFHPHIYEMRFCEEAFEAAHTFLLCCTRLPLHKDIARHIAQMIYHSEWDQVWKHLHFSNRGIFLD